MNKPLRVAMLSEHASPTALLGGEDAGGQNVYVDQVSRRLGAMGYAVDVYTRRDSTAAPETMAWAPGVRIVNVCAGPPAALLKDAIWPHMPAFRDEILRFMRRDGACYDVLHGNFWMSGHVGVDLSRRLDIPLVQIFHATGLTKRRHQGDQDTSAAERVAIERGVVAGAARVIAQCPTERDELIDDYGADPARVALVPSGVDTECFRPVPRDAARRRIGLEGDGPVVVYVGRMLPRKDVRNVVRAVALLAAGAPGVGRVPGVRLLVVGGEAPDAAGEGEGLPGSAGVSPASGAGDAVAEAAEVRRLAAELGIAERVIFAGRRQPEVLRDYYSAADVAATTPWYEPFGLTPLEAMACGRPVVGSAVGGITSTIAEGSTGYLVPPRDPLALAQRLGEILSSAELGARMGLAARQRVEEHFTWPVVAARTAAVYREALARVAPREAGVREVVAGGGAVRVRSGATRR